MKMNAGGGGGGGGDHEKQLNQMTEFQKERNLTHIPGQGLGSGKC